MGGSSTQLSIILSLVNEASAQLAQASEQFAAFATGAATDVSDAATSMAASFNSVEEAAIASAQAALEQWGSDASEAAATVGDDYNEIATMAAAAAASTSEAWDASIANLQSMMAEANSSTATDFSNMTANAEKSGSEMESSVSSVGGKFQAVGIQMGLLGAAALAPVVASIGDATDKASTLAQGLNQINNIIQGAGGAGGENATQIASLSAKIDGYKASIASAEVALGKYTGTADAVNAAHEKADATIASATANLQKYENELAPLLSQQSLVGDSAQSVSDQFSGLATQNTNLGISFEDSYNALVGFLNQTKSTKDATAEYGAAVDLVASGKIPDMTTATQDVTQAFNGMGRSLQAIVPDMKDGVSGMDAVNQIASALAGSPAVALQQVNTQMAALSTNGQELGATMASGLLPALTSFLETVNSILVKVTAWAAAHPKLSEVILISVGIIGSLLVLLGLILTPLGLIIIASEAFTLVLAAGLLPALGGILLTVGLVFAAFVAFAVVVALVVVYHQQILAAITYTWNAVIDYVSDKMLAIYNAFQSWGSEITKWWTGLWNGIYSALEAIWGKISGVINSILSAISKVTGGVSSVAGAIGGGVSSAFSGLGSILHVNDAIITPGGQVIQTDAADYLFATKNPGALGGGGGSVNVYIQGGNYLDSNGATMIGNALAQQIGRQLKLRNYAA